MQTKHTAENTEASAVKVSRNSLAWENLGVKFRQSRSMELSLDGISFPKICLLWTAWHKAEYLAGKKGEIEDVVEHMNQHAERYLSIIAKRNSRK